MSPIFVYFRQFTQKRKPLMVDESDVTQLTLTLKMNPAQVVKNVSHCQQQQSYSRLHSPGRSYST